MLFYNYFLAVSKNAINFLCLLCILQPYLNHLLVPVLFFFLEYLGFSVYIIITNGILLPLFQSVAFYFLFPALLPWPGSL